MRHVAAKYVDGQPDGRERTNQLIALLAVGLERLLRAEKESAGSPDNTVDFLPDVSVTTDGQSDEQAEEA